MAYFKILSQHLLVGTDEIIKPKNVWLVYKLHKTVNKMLCSFGTEIHNIT